MMIDNLFQWLVLASGISFLAAPGATAFTRFRNTRVVEEAMMLVSTVFVLGLVFAKLTFLELASNLRGVFGLPSDAIQGALVCVTCVLAVDFLWDAYFSRG